MDAYEHHSEDQAKQIEQTNTIRAVLCGLGLIAVVFVGILAMVGSYSSRFAPMFWTWWVSGGVMILVAGVLGLLQSWFEGRAAEEDEIGTEGYAEAVKLAETVPAAASALRVWTEHSAFLSNRDLAELRRLAEVERAASGKQQLEQWIAQPKQYM